MKFAAVFMFIAMAIFIFSVSVASGNPLQSDSSQDQKPIQTCESSDECPIEKLCINNRCVPKLPGTYYG